MSGDKYVKARTEAVACVSSLHIAMQNAGGSIMSTEKLESMTVMEFITTIASQNNIRFYHKPVENNE